MEDYPDSVLTRRVIGLAIEVHRNLGPGLLESAYEECLCFELDRAGMPFTRQQKLPVRYKGNDLDCRFQMDIVVQDSLILEIKSVEQIAPSTRHNCRLTSASAGSISACC